MLSNARPHLDLWLQDGDNCDYIIVLQQGEGVAPLDPLPVLPPNARYLRHPNSCFDFGTIGWVLDTQVGQMQGREWATSLSREG